MRNSVDPLWLGMDDRSSVLFEEPVGLVVVALAMSEVYPSTALRTVTVVEPPPDPYLYCETTMRSNRIAWLFGATVKDDVFARIQAGAPSRRVVVAGE